MDGHTSSPHLHPPHVSVCHIDEIEKKHSPHSPQLARCNTVPFGTMSTPEYARPNTPNMPDQPNTPNMPASQICQTNQTTQTCQPAKQPKHASQPNTPNMPTNQRSTLLRTE
mmetsp:Transcript_20192/g.34733  ORF Transcript_20192/g.34733 Transcript_20192/m.34733 type:complete len:112 (+) Transcript_20192:288-623(+)